MRVTLRALIRCHCCLPPRLISIRADAAVADASRACICHDAELFFAADDADDDAMPATLMPLRFRTPICRHAFIFSPFWRAAAPCFSPRMPNICRAFSLRRHAIVYYACLCLWRRRATIYALRRYAFYAALMRALRRRCRARHYFDATIAAPALQEFATMPPPAPTTTTLHARRATTLP